MFMRYVMIHKDMPMVYAATAYEPALTVECQKHGDQQVLMYIARRVEFFLIRMLYIIS